MKKSVVIMGVAGCGKSSLGAMLAQRTGTDLVEGDDYHSPTSREKMSQGIPLTDADREGWLETLGELLRQSPNGAVLTCSALKKAYRDRLRAAAPGLGFIYLEIRPDEALRRVTARAGDHFFPVKLVDSQFATLESPVSEAGVLALDGMLSLAELTEQALVWINKGEGDE
ncbi:MAG: gluconokinase [Propionivibrio sp.]|nr:gluconokinase [Propionivibrio sp.]